MSVTTVIGGQYGSEGKGKIAALIASKEKADLCIRTGGPNAGHGLVVDGNRIVLRQIPCCALVGVPRILIPAGGVIDVGVLTKEIELLGLTKERLGIDFRAAVISKACLEKEQGMWKSISSTQCGVGEATARKVLRGDQVVLAQRVPELKQFLVNATEEVNQAIDCDKTIIVEGTQGYGLSLHHTMEYPKATSRDTTAAAMLSECGISPLSVTDIVMVLRTFPIRVAGKQAGSLYQEITWDQLRFESGSNRSLEERTTVTNRVRRVGRFDISQVLRAVKANRPTAIALNFVDHLDARCREAASYEQLLGDYKVLQFVDALEKVSGVPVKYLGVGGSLAETFQRELS